MTVDACKFHRRPARLPICVLLLAVWALAAHALPRGYKEDFNGCATQSPDDTDRARCCMETFRQCQTQCNKDFADQGDYNGAILCASECLSGQQQCKDGNAIPLRPAWPGVNGVDIPGLLVKGDRLTPAGGYDLVAGRGAVLVESRPKGPLAEVACTAFVVACQCPDGAGSRGQECRAWIDGNATACRICPRGARAEAYKPCPDCRPDVLSAQRCDADDLPAPRRHGSKK